MTPLSLPSQYVSVCRGGEWTNGKSLLEVKIPTLTGRWDKHAANNSNVLHHDEVGGWLLGSIWTGYNPCTPGDVTLCVQTCNALQSAANGGGGVEDNNNEGRDSGV
jgi:hypothetical protein